MDRECFWVPVVWPSGRISTLFYDTDCGKRAVLPTDAVYCYFCSGKLDVMSHDAMREYIMDSAADLAE